jgi:hypothetical protein
MRRHFFNRVPLSVAEGLTATSFRRQTFNALVKHSARSFQPVNLLLLLADNLI